MARISRALLTEIARNEWGAPDVLAVPANSICSQAGAFPSSPIAPGRAITSARPRSGAMHATRASVAAPIDAPVNIAEVHPT